MLRMECLNLIGSLNHIAISQESLLSLVVQFSSDTDPRVRRASIHSLVGEYMYMYPSLLIIVTSK